MIVGGLSREFGAAFSVNKIEGREWGISLALGVVSIPWGAVIRCMPNGPFYSLFDRLGLFGKPDVLPTANPETGTWAGARKAVEDTLATFTSIRGARLRSSSFAMRSRKAKAEDHIASMIIVPTMTAAAPVSGASYKPQAGSLSDPAAHDPSKSSAALWEGKLQIHPDTAPDDPVYRHIDTASRVGNTATSNV